MHEDRHGFEAVRNRDVGIFRRKAVAGSVRKVKEKTIRLPGYGRPGFTGCRLLFFSKNVMMNDRKQHVRGETDAG